MRNYIQTLLVATCCLASPLFLTAQQSKNPSTNTSVDARLYAAFGKSYIDLLVQEDPFLIKRWTFYLDNAFFISDTPLSKNGEEPANLLSVRISDLSQINILKLEAEQPQLVRDFHYEKIYKIAGTTKYLVYYPGQMFVEKLKEHLASVGNKQ